MKQMKRITIIVIASLLLIVLAFLNIKFSFIIIPDSNDMSSRQIDFITIGTVFAGFSFTALGLLLGLSSEKLIERIKNDLKENLTEYRYIHSLGVMEMAEELAKVYNVDVESARIAGLLHDIAKEMTKEESLEYVEKNNIAIDEVEKINVSLLHGKIGAHIAKTLYDVSEQIQKAIEYHTETSPNMDELAKIIYVSDKIERNRKSEKFDLDAERELARKDLDGAVLFIIDASIEKLVKKEKLMHPTIVKTRNKLLMERM